MIRDHRPSMVEILTGKDSRDNSPCLNPALKGQDCGKKPVRKKRKLKSGTGTRACLCPTFYIALALLLLGSIPLCHPRLRYFATHNLSLYLPAAYYAQRRASLLSHEIPDDVRDRVNYYMKRQAPFTLSDNAVSIEGFKENRGTFYVLDTWEALKYFPRSLRFDRLFGDITTVPPSPHLLKSRPIARDNENSILLKLDQLRHFRFVNDRKSYLSKQNRLVWRGAAYQPHRIDFVNRYSDHPLCDVKDTKDKKNRLTIKEQLDYKFILSLEGNDVATNLKWIFSSNSLCFAPKHKYETWFMEGRLIPNYHYVQIADDYSDLAEKIAYYTNHPDEALAIIEHAHAHVDQFRDRKKEELIALLVLQKYFSLAH